MAACQVEYPFHGAHRPSRVAVGRPAGPVGLVAGSVGLVGTAGVVRGSAVRYGAVGGRRNGCESDGLELLDGGEALLVEDPMPCGGGGRYTVGGVDSPKDPLPE